LSSITSSFEKLSQRSLRKTIILIFATVGSSKTPFDRLVKAVDGLASIISEQVIVQLGASNYQPRAASYFKYCDSEKIASFIKEANIVISHAGFGIIADCIRMNKRLILIPREQRFGDAEGNQVELAEYLAKNSDGIICIRDVNKLQAALIQVQNTTPCYQFTNKIPEMVQSFIDRRLG